MFDDENKKDNNSTVQGDNNQAGSAPPSIQTGDDKPNEEGPPRNNRLNLDVNKGKFPEQTSPPDPAQADKPLAKASEVKSSLNGEVQDILAGTEDVPAKPDIFKPKEPAAAPPFLPDKEKDGSNKDNRAKKIIILVVIIIAVAGIVLGGFYLVKKFLSAPSDVVPEESIDVGIDLDEPADKGEADEQIDEPAERIILQDSDQDSLTDEEEIELGTDINKVDSDDDGLFDREEVKVYETDPLNADSDNDGLLDGEEVLEGRNPLGEGMLYNLPGSNPLGNELIDTDNDGLLDEDEVKYGTDITSSDSDNDGLADYQEIKVYKTDPMNADTDGDSYLDGAEVENGYNPNGEGKIR